MNHPQQPTRHLVLIGLVALGLLIGVLRLAGPERDLYPVEGDSAKYHLIARGFAELFAHPVTSLKLWISHSATPADLQRYGFDSWVLQHAPAYTALLGLFYLLPGDDVAAGRLATVLIFALGAALLYLLGQAVFGHWAGLLSALLYLFWPAHWFYGPAILTELPMAVAGLLAAYGMMRTGDSNRPLRWLLGGAAIGLLVLTKTPLRFVAIPWIVIEALIDRTAGARQSVRRGILRLAGYGTTQALWLLFLFGFGLSADPLRQLGEDWLWVYRGDYVPDRGWESVGTGDALTPELEEGARLAALVPPAQQKGEAYRQAFRATLRHYPAGMAALVLGKAGIYWCFPAVKTFVRVGPLSLPPPSRVQPALAVAALFGLALCLGPGWGRRSLPAIVPIFLTALYSATHLVSRYNIPAVPFAMLYAAGAATALAASIRCALRRARAERFGIFRAARPIALQLLAAIAALVLAAFLLRMGRAGLAAPLLAAVGLFPLLRLWGGGGRLGAIRALAVLVPLCVLAIGARANDPDPDERKIHLSHPGDGVRLRLALPPEAQPSEFIASELLVDLLPSPRGTMTLSFRVSGTEVARYVGRPESGPDRFLLDEEINKGGDRYRKVLRSVERHLEECVRMQPGLRDAGYDYYRQWYRIPIDPHLAFGAQEPVLDVVLVSADGGSVDLYLDRDAPASAATGRVIEMPAFFLNSYELSSYRFDTLASRRELADSRLIRPIRVMSDRRGAELFDAHGRLSEIRGEPRIRVRGKLPGGYGIVRGEGGAVDAAFLADPAGALRMLTPEEILSLQADRDRYFDGYLTF